MEFNTIMQALVKDIAEQLRPMVAEMVRQELAACQPDMAVIAQNIDLDVVAGHINLALLAEELTSCQLSDIADHVSMSDLASQLDTTKICEDLDLDHAIGEWFSNQSFDIRVS
jgi:hypothetical protein